MPISLCNTFLNNRQDTNVSNVLNLLLGWAMQVAAFIFIQRKWEDDKNHFEKMLDYFCDIREPLQLLIFPEGTDLTGESILLSLLGSAEMEILVFRKWFQNM